MNNAYPKKDADSSRRVSARNELDSKLDEFYSKGGTVTKCAPGPTEGLILSKFSRRREKPAVTAGAEETPETPAEAPVEASPEAGQA